MDKLIDLQRRFEDVCFTLSTEDIYNLDQRSNGHINNVIAMISRHCYGVELIDDEVGLATRMYYINNDNGLKGDIICLDLDDPDYQTLLLRFGVTLSLQYAEVDAINSFNILQTQLRTFLEKRGFFTATTFELERFRGKHAVMVGISKRGFKNVQFLNRVNYYRDFFNGSYSQELLPNTDYVYLMVNDDTSLIKIGTSKNPKYRERTLHSKEPNIHIIALWKGERVVEKKLHQIFKNKRVRGEWFRLTIPDLKEIDEYMN